MTLLAQIPDLPIPKTFDELALQLAWIVVIALFVIVLLLAQLARITLLSRARKAETLADENAVEATNAKIVADLAVQALKFRDALDELKAQSVREREHFASEIERRDKDSRERDEEIHKLKQSIDELKAAHKREVDRLLGELKNAYAERDAQLKRANSLEKELDTLREKQERTEERLRKLEKGTGELTPPADPSTPTEAA